MQQSKEFEGRSVFVSGGTTGINLGIADAFAAAGAKVTVMSRKQENVDAAVKQLSRHGGEVYGHVADVRNYEAVHGAMAAAHAKFGDIDILVSGAAGNFLAPALGLSSNGFKTVVDIDLNGTFHVMRASHEFLRKPGASIINISAPQSVNPAPMQIHACAAKAGLDQVMRVLAIEWGEHGIRVNSILPGAIAGTTGIEKLIPKAQRDTISQRVPLRRLGTLDDIAQMAMFLGSSKSSYVTGALIPVDGGAVLLGGRNHAGETPSVDAGARA